MKIASGATVFVGEFAEGRRPACGGVAGGRLTAPAHRSNGGRRLDRKIAAERRNDRTGRTDVRDFGPPAAPGMRIGLLGGSFDPPHPGHAHITLEAIRRMRLDRVWWLVSPGNPLKSRGPASLARRMAACRAVMRHPKVWITDIEARLGTRFTADTLARMIALYPRAHFVWLMGADNMVTFHRWEHWDWILENAPIGVLARPDQQVRAGLAPAARAYRRHRLPERAAHALPTSAAPAWSLLVGPTVRISSTALRRDGLWPQRAENDSASQSREPSELFETRPAFYTS